VNEGQVTFTVINSSTHATVCTSAPAAVSNGSATGTCALPAGLNVGSYAITAAYSESSSGNFMDSVSTNSANLVVAAASTSVTADDSATTYNELAQSVSLTAGVSSPAGVVKEGRATFTVTNPSTHAIVCTSAPAAVSNGSATGTCALPAGLNVGSYAISVAYSDTSSGNFMTSASTNSASLVIQKAPTTLQAAPVKNGLLTHTFSATLTQTSNDKAVAGQSIKFSYQGAGVCSANTNSNGTASCTVIGLFIVLGPADDTATYAGDGDYLPSTDSAAL
jgi:hypothetical protein